MGSLLNAAVILDMSDRIPYFPSPNFDKAPVLMSRHSNKGFVHPASRKTVPGCTDWSFRGDSGCWFSGQEEISWSFLSLEIVLFQ